MANQIARPSVDTIIGGYTDQAGGVTNIYQRIDEVVADDADYVRSRNSPINDPYVTKLSTLLNPNTNAAHIIRYRYAVKPGMADQLDLVVQLRRLYVHEADRGFLVKQWTHALVGDTFTTAEQTLTEGEADDILDYNDLVLRFTFNIAGVPIP